MHLLILSFFLSRHIDTSLRRIVKPSEKKISVNWPSNEENPLSNLDKLNNVCIISRTSTQYYRCPCGCKAHHHLVDDISTNRSLRNVSRMT